MIAYSVDIGESCINVPGNNFIARVPVDDDGFARDAAGLWKEESGGEEEGHEVKLSAFFFRTVTLHSAARSASFSFAVASFDP
jgi:hypothetical protein